MLIRSDPPSPCARFVRSVPVCARLAKPQAKLQPLSGGCVGEVSFLSSTEHDAPSRPTRPDDSESSYLTSLSFVFFANRKWLLQLSQTWYVGYLSSKEHDAPSRPTRGGLRPISWTTRTHLFFHRLIFALFCKQKVVATTP